jgi:hypothetical protein
MTTALRHLSRTENFVSTQQPESLITIHNLEHPRSITRRIRPCLALIRLEVRLVPRRIRRSKTKPVRAGGDIEAKFNAPLWAAEDVPFGRTEEN